MELSIYANIQCLHYWALLALIKLSNGNAVDILTVLFRVSQKCTQQPYL